MRAIAGRTVQVAAVTWIRGKQPAPARTSAMGVCLLGCGLQWRILRAGGTGGGFHQRGEARRSANARPAVLRCAERALWELAELVLNGMEEESTTGVLGPQAV